MLSQPRKGLRPLSFFLAGLCLAHAAHGQVLPPWKVDAHASRDVSDWSEFALAPVPPASSLPTDDADFAAVSKGGPWTAAEHQPLRPSQRVVMELARAGRWSQLLDALKAESPELDVRDRDGATLLTLAARRGQMDVVRELLRRGADVNRRGLFGLTPLGAAALGGHDLVVQDLLREGAELERWSASGHTPLHLAAREGQARVVRTLLAAGADPMALARDGRHPLDEAAQTGQFDAMAALLAAGVKADAPDGNGLNALHAAALSRQFEAVEWLRQRGASAPHPLTQVLLERPADPPPTLP